MLASFFNKRLHCIPIRQLIKSSLSKSQKFQIYSRLPLATTLHKTAYSLGDAMNKFINFIAVLTILISSAFADEFKGQVYEIKFEKIGEPDWRYGQQIELQMKANGNSGDFTIKTSTLYQNRLDEFVGPFKLYLQPDGNVIAIKNFLNLSRYSVGIISKDGTHLVPTKFCRWHVYDINQDGRSTRIVVFEKLTGLAGICG